MMCCRCGYGETWYRKYDEDGDHCGWKHEITRGVGVLWYRDTGESAFCSQPLSTSKNVLAAESWLREQIANGSIEAETAEFWARMREQHGGKSMAKAAITS
jgi:hypothetical protein